MRARLRSTSGRPPPPTDTSSPSPPTPAAAAPPPPMDIDDAMAFLLHLSSHLLSHAAPLAAGSAALLLSLRALTRLHRLRVELQRRLSDRAAVREGRVCEIAGLPVVFVTQMFSLLATLKHLQVEASDSEIAMVQEQTCRDAGRTAHTVDDAERAATDSTPADGDSTPRRRLHFSTDDHDEPPLLPASIATAIAVPAAPSAASSAASPFVSLRRAHHVLDFTLFPSLVCLELRRLPWSSPFCAVHLRGVDRLKSRLEKLSVRSCWIGELQHLLAFNPTLEDALDEAHVEASFDDEGIFDPEVVRRAHHAHDHSTPWHSLRYLSIRSSLISADASLSLLPALELLDLGGNALGVSEGEFPAKWLGSSAQLQFVDAGYNSLRAIPMHLHALVGNISTLVLRNNKLTAIAPLGACYSLEKLDVSWNFLDDLRDMWRALRNLPQIQFVWSSGNPLSELPQVRVVMLAMMWPNRLAAIVKENKARSDAKQRQTQRDFAASLHAAAASPAVGADGFPIAPILVDSADPSDDDGEQFFLDDLPATKAELLLAREMAELGLGFDDADTTHTKHARRLSRMPTTDDAGASAALLPLSPSSVSSAVGHTELDRAEQARVAATAMLALSPRASVLSPSIPSSDSRGSHGSRDSSDHDPPLSASSTSLSLAPAHLRSPSQSLSVVSLVARAADRMRSHKVATPQQKKKGGKKKRVARIIDEGGVEEGDADEARKDEEPGKEVGTIEQQPDDPPPQITGQLVSSSPDAPSSSPGAAVPSPASASLSALHAKLNLSSFLSTLENIKVESGAHWLTSYRQFQTARQEAERQLAEKNDERASVHSKKRNHRRGSVDSLASFSSRRIKEADAHARSRAEHRAASSAASNGISTATSSRSPALSTASTPTGFDSPRTQRSSPITLPLLEPESQASIDARLAEWEHLVAVTARHARFALALTRRPSRVEDSGVDQAEIDMMLAESYECVADRVDDGSGLDVVVPPVASGSHIATDEPSPHTYAGSRLLSCRHHTMQELHVASAQPAPTANAHVLLHAAIQGKRVQLMLADMSAANTTSSGSSVDAASTYKLSGSVTYVFESEQDAREMHAMLTRHLSSAPAAPVASEPPSSSSVPSVTTIDREIQLVAARTEQLRRTRASLDADDGDEHSAPVAPAPIVQATVAAPIAARFFFVYVTPSPLLAAAPPHVPCTVSIPLYLFQFPSDEFLQSSSRSTTPNNRSRLHSQKHSLGSMASMSLEHESALPGSPHAAVNPAMHSHRLSLSSLVVDPVSSRPVSRSHSRAGSPDRSAVGSPPPQASSPPPTHLKTPQTSPPSGLAKLLQADRDAAASSDLPAAHVADPHVASIRPGAIVAPAADVAADLYTELLYGERPSSSAIRHTWSVALLPHPLCQWGDSSSHSSRAPTKVNESAFSARALLARVSSSLANRHSTSAATAVSHDSVDMYTGGFLALTESHLMFYSSTESEAQLRQREALALERAAGRPTPPPVSTSATTAFPSFGSGVATEASTGADSTDSKLSASHVPASHLLSSSTPLGSPVASHAPVPVGSSTKRQVVARKQLHKTYSSMLVAPPANTKTAATPSTPSKPTVAAAPVTAPITIAARRAHQRGGPSVDWGGSEGESSSESDRDNDEEATATAAAAASSSPRQATASLRAGRDRGDKQLTSSRARIGATSGRSPGGSLLVLPPVAASSLVDPAPRLGLSHHRVSSRGLDDASLAMLRQLETEGSRPEARTGRSPSPLRVSLRRRREMAKRHRGEAVTEQDLYQDVDREYGGVAAEAAMGADGAEPTDAESEMDEPDADDLASQLSSVDASLPESSAACAAPAAVSSGSVLPLCSLVHESFVGLARAVLGLGMQYLRLEFYSGSALFVLTGCKRLTSSIVVSLQSAYLAHNRSTLLIDNEDLVCLSLMQAQVFGTESAENLRAYEVVRLLDFGSDNEVSGGVCAPALSSSSVLSPVPSSFHSALLLSSMPDSHPLFLSSYVPSRVSLPGVLSVVLLCSGCLYLCEELCLFQHCVADGNSSSKAKDGRKHSASVGGVSMHMRHKSQSKSMQRVIAEWCSASRLDDQCRAALSTSASSSDDCVSVAPSSCASVRRYRILAVEPITQLRHVQQHTDHTHTHMDGSGTHNAQHARSTAHT